MCQAYDMGTKKTLELPTSKHVKFGWRVRQGSRYCGYDVIAMTKAVLGPWRVKERHLIQFCAVQERFLERGLFQSESLPYLFEVRGVDQMTTLALPYSEFCATEHSE